PLRDAVPASRSSTEDGEGFASFWGGVSLLKSDPQARMLVLMLGTQCVALGALDVLYVEVAQAVLHRGGAWAGYLSGAFGAGGVLAVAVTASLVGRRHLAKPLVLSLGVWSLTFFGLAALPGAIAALLLLGVAGGARATFDVTGRTLLQRVARPDLLARIFGLLEGLQMAGLAVGSGLAPVLIALGGAKAALVGVGVILPLAAIADGRRLLDIDRHATVPIVEIALLRSIPLFAPLPPPTLESIARSLVPVSVPAGAEVIRQGEPGDRFYAIADGQLDVIADGKFVTTLGRGAGFGEIALMSGVPRTATVTARSDATLYALERDTFLVAVTGHTTARTIAQDLVDTRLEELRTLREGTVETNRIAP
ncbi:MAG: cyclic nucleotide-binding domain-containing protein, partial [Gaiellaceae bacterium]